MSLSKKQIGYVLVILLVLLSKPHLALARGPIVVLLSSDAESFRQAASGTIDTLKDSKTRIIILDRNPENTFHTMNKISVMSPPVIIAIGNQAALALKNYPIEAPIVFCLIVDHRTALALPNSVGVSMHISPKDAYSNMLHILPGTRIGVPFNPERTKFLVDDLTHYFKGRRTEIVPIPLKKPSDIGPALKSTGSKLDAIWILPDPSIIHPLSIKYLMDYSRKKRIPIVGYSKAFTKAGAIFSIASSYEDMGRQAGTLSKKVLSGEPVAELHYPEKIQRFANLRVAKSLNIPIPNQFYASIDKIYPLEPSLR